MHSRLTSDLILVIHDHIQCVMLTENFKSVVDHLVQVTAVLFWLQTGDTMLMTEGVYHCQANI